jgi:hypothetical protein
MTIILFITALALSATAAYYSIAGLAAVFSAASTSIILMGSILEVAKLVTISWLYRNWKTVPILLKTYFMVAVLILMLITSMGVFGYLSKAHLEQTASTSASSVQIEILEERIESIRQNVDLNKRALAQMDESVNQIIARSSTEDSALRASNLRRSQQRERNRIVAEIQTQQGEISKLSQELSPLKIEVKKLEAEVGPIKYIASLIYGNELNQTLIENAVKYFILLIIVVFDPLAVLLFIAFNIEQLKNPNSVYLFSKRNYTIKEDKQDVKEPEFETQGENISVDDEIKFSEKFELYKDKPDGTKLKFLLD